MKSKSTTTIAVIQEKSDEAVTLQHRKKSLATMFCHLNEEITEHLLLNCNHMDQQLRSSAHNEFYIGCPN